MFLVFLRYLSSSFTLQRGNVCVVFLAAVVVSVVVVYYRCAYVAVLAACAAPLNTRQFDAPSRASHATPRPAARPALAGSSSAAAPRAPGSGGVMSGALPGAGEAWQGSAEALLVAFESLLQEVEVEAPAGHAAPRTKWSSEELLASCQALLDDAREVVLIHQAPPSPATDHCPTPATPVPPRHQPLVQQPVATATSPAPRTGPRSSPLTSRACVGDLSAVPASLPSPAMAAVPPGCPAACSADCVPYYELHSQTTPGTVDSRDARVHSGARVSDSIVGQTASVTHVPVVFLAPAQPPPPPDTLLATGRSGSADVEGQCAARAACGKAEEQEGKAGVTDVLEAVALRCAAECRPLSSAVSCVCRKAARRLSEDEESLFSFRTCSSGEVESPGWCSASEGEADSDTESECSLAGFVPTTEDVWQWNPSYEESRRDRNDAAVPPDEDSDAGGLARGRCQQVVDAPPPPHPVLDIQALGRLAESLTRHAITRKRSPSAPSRRDRSGAAGGEAGPGEEGCASPSRPSTVLPVPDEPCRHPVPRDSAERQARLCHSSAEENLSAGTLGGDLVQEEEQQQQCAPHGSTVTSATSPAQSSDTVLLEVPHAATPTLTSPAVQQTSKAPPPECCHVVTHTAFRRQEQLDISLCAASIPPPCEEGGGGGSVGGEAQRIPTSPEASDIWCSYQSEALQTSVPVTYSSFPFILSYFLLHSFILSSFLSFLPTLAPPLRA
ncbi:hypothetical protein E2C01_035607 [Portunus trituberculatus]|uniref:Uncharacterized protein n=1 Tax=Portunus trituberculatus TaxID=210409 RepID=A0A5B7F8T9_PORTR|nr:hypothetical protein [Portunus trituberculatus]